MTNNIISFQLVPFVEGRHDHNHHRQVSVARDEEVEAAITVRETHVLVVDAFKSLDATTNMLPVIQSASSDIQYLNCAPSLAAGSWTTLYL